jgi:hypothetical protein
MATINKHLFSDVTRIAAIQAREHKDTILKEQIAERIQAQEEAQQALRSQIEHAVREVIGDRLDPTAVNDFIASFEYVYSEDGTLPVTSEVGAIDVKDAGAYAYIPGPVWAPVSMRHDERLGIVWKVTFACPWQDIVRPLSLYYATNVEPAFAPSPWVRILTDLDVLACLVREDGVIRVEANEVTNESLYGDLD